MGLFDGLGEHDSPERKAGVKRQQAAWLQEQLAEQARMRDPRNDGEPGSQRHARQEPGAQRYARPVDVERPGHQPPPQYGRGSYAPAPSYAAAPSIHMPQAPAPGWPWQGGVAPFQAWRSPSGAAAAAKPQSFFPRPQNQAVGWKAPQTRSQVDEVVYGHDIDYSAARANGARRPQTHLSPSAGLHGAGRGVMRPLTSAKGGWLPPQMRSQADDLIYGHDLDGYSGAGKRIEQAPSAGWGPPGPQIQQPVQAQAQRRAVSPGPKIDIDSEWAAWEAEHPNFRRRRRVDASQNNRVDQSFAPESNAGPPISARDGHKANNNNNNAPVIDIDAEWAEWENNHPEFKRRNKRREPAAGATSAPAGGATSPSSAARNASPERPPAPASPPRAPPPIPDISTVRPPPPDGIRFGGKSRISEDLRGAAASSLDDEFYSIRHSCAEQRALLHLQVERLRAEASRLLAEEANVPSKMLFGRGISQMPLLGAPNLFPAPQNSPSSPLLRLLEEQRRIASQNRSGTPPPHLAFRAGNIGNVGVSQDLALAELRLAAVEAETKKRAYLPALPDYPVVSENLGNGPPNARTLQGGTLKGSSEFVSPDTVRYTHLAPASNKYDAYVAQQLALPSGLSPNRPEKTLEEEEEEMPSDNAALFQALSFNSVTTEKRVGQRIVVRPAEDEAGDAVAQVMTGAIASVNSESAEAHPEPTPRGGGSELSVDFNHAFQKKSPGEVVNNGTQKSADLSSLAFSGTNTEDFVDVRSSSHRSIADAQPLQAAPFSRVCADLGAELRKVNSAEPATDASAAATTSGDEVSPQIADRWSNMASALTRDTSGGSSAEGGAAPSERTATPTSRDGVATVDTTSPAPSPPQTKSQPASPRQLLPRPFPDNPDATRPKPTQDDSEDGEKPTLDDTEDGDATQLRRTQNEAEGFLMSALIPDK